MNNEVFISVIIPVYNAEKYINQCVQSILEYPGDDLEIILVDDGSKDDSLKICCALETGDGRVHVISKKNGGVSSARNQGIENASGKYIMFADADDYYSAGAFLKIKELLQQPRECVLFRYNIQQEKSVPIAITVKEIQTYGMEYVAQNYWSLLNGGMINPVWNKIYQSKIINDNKIRFDEMSTFSEDGLFNAEYFTVCNQVTLMPDELYNYVMHPGQATTKQHPAFFDMVDCCFDAIEQFVTKYTQLSTDHYNEWLNVIINAFYHQNYKMHNADKIMNHERTKKMCKYARPKDKKSKVCLWFIKHRMIKTVCFMCFVKEKLYAKKYSQKVNG